VAWLKPARLLASVLEAVAEVGIGIGGRKSAGLGLLELESSEFHAFEPGKDGGGKEVYNSDPYSPRTDSVPELRLSLVTREHEREVMECRSTAAFGPVLPPAVGAPIRSQPGSGPGAGHAGRGAQSLGGERDSSLYLLRRAHRSGLEVFRVWSP
jgi:hypothetical protein